MSIECCVVGVLLLLLISSGDVRLVEGAESRTWHHWLVDVHVAEAESLIEMLLAEDPVTSNDVDPGPLQLVPLLVQDRGCTDQAHNAG